MKIDKRRGILHARWSSVLAKGTFTIYVDMKGWVGGQSNVYAHKVNDHFLFTSIVYKG